MKNLMDEKINWNQIQGLNAVVVQGRLLSNILQMCYSISFFLKAKEH